MARAVLFSLFLGPAVAHISQGRTQHGLIGYGITMYDPGCAAACRDTVSSWMLDCGDAGNGGASHHGEMHHETPSPLCYATNDPFLQTLALCMNMHCEGETISKLENWWEKYLVGRQPGQPQPKVSYQQALAAISRRPTTIIGDENILNATSLVDDDIWLSNYNGDHGYDITEATSSTYGLVLLLTCTVIPIAFSLLRFVPMPQAFVSRFYAYCIDPPVFGRHHAVPVMGLAIVPTRGQALFILYIWFMNIVLSAVGYNITWPNSWYSTKPEEVVAYVGNRAGVLSFANLGLVVLYSSRNNILLYLTNWSHSTFLLVHRWIAVICTIQACIHSAVWLQIYIKQGAQAHAEQAAYEYWIWGVIATLALVIMLPLSVLPIRQRIYEVFLALHVALAILSMIGCLLHIYYRFTWQWGYETWVYIAFVIWGFDRFFARPLRLFRNGVKRAYVTVVDSDYLQIYIPGIEASGIAYLYFPTLSWRIWENHPFSVAAISSLEIKRVTSRAGSDLGSEVEHKDSAKKETVVATRSISNGNKESGILFFVRRRGGLTGKLDQYAALHTGALTLVESSYGSEQMSAIPSPTTEPSLEFPNTILIAGGVGITSLLPLLDRFNGLGTPTGKAKLFWGVRTEPLVVSVEAILRRTESRVNGKARWGNVEVQVKIGERYDLHALLEAELHMLHRGTTVVVCGPPGMADDARIAVTSLARQGKTVRLSEHSFSW
ncbi:ferric reductase like transmembrane component-domain-containing protein [Phaeosphaeria sp. MPI-PUGE-AT-0046c]|nr:ferric reductase like transmembrane component-domain-containing protein [Phaeosphaeria sp. MPI-PUGE-AT-0046c]